MIDATDTVAVPNRPAGESIARRGAARLRLRALAQSPDARALAVIAVVVALANLPSLLGLFDANPLDFRSGLTGALTPGLLGGRPTIDPSNGFVSQALGHLSALDLLHLHLPWWNPYEGTGMPLLGETESAALFPLTLLTALANGQLYEHVLLELIAGVATYRLLLRLGVTRVAAVAGSIAFALNGKFAWFADATVNPLPFLPLVLLGIERAHAATRAGRPGGWRLMALAGGLSVYAGFPEVSYIDTLMCLVWAGWRCGCLERGHRRAFASKVALGGAAGALLAAPALVAMVSSLSIADLGVHAGTRLAGAHLGLPGLPQLLLPYAYGPINGDPHIATWIAVGGYVSTALIALAVVGVMSPGRRGLRMTLLGWGLLVFARMFGVPALGQVIGVLPGMSRIEFYRYATGALELSVIVLAALGVDAVVRDPAYRIRLVWAALAVGGAVAAAALYARGIIDPLGSALDHPAYLYGSVGWGVAVTAAVAGAGALRSGRARGAVLVSVVALDALVLFALPELSAPRSAPLDRAPVSYLRDHLGEQRFFTLAGGTRGLTAPVAPNYGSYFALGSFGIDDFPPQRYADYVHAHADPWAAFVGFRARAAPTRRWELLHHLGGYRRAAVGYVLVPTADAVHSHALQLVFRTPTTLIYRLRGASSYFTATRCQVTSTDRDRASVDCRRPALLIRRETWYAGWSARVDGHPVTVGRVDGLFQAVAVPAGAHRVTFDFAPPGMQWALLALLGGCALLGAPSLRRRVVRRSALR